MSFLILDNKLDFFSDFFEKVKELSRSVLFVRLNTSIAVRGNMRITQYIKLT
jgi:hypothetical protein